jgi:ATP-dependent RNA helicase A
MAAESDIKAYLYAWLGKKKATPDYNLRPTGPKHRQRFLCELRVTVCKQIRQISYSCFKIIIL